MQPRYLENATYACVCTCIHAYAYFINFSSVHTRSSYRAASICQLSACCKRAKIVAKLFAEHLLNIFTGKKNPSSERSRSLAESTRKGSVHTERRFAREARELCARTYTGCLESRALSLGTRMAIRGYYSCHSILFFFHVINESRVNQLPGRNPREINEKYASRISRL